MKFRNDFVTNSSSSSFVVSYVVRLKNGDLLSAECNRSNGDYDGNGLDALIIQDGKEERFAVDAPRCVEAIGVEIDPEDIESFPYGWFDELGPSTDLRNIGKVPSANKKDATVGRQIRSIMPEPPKMREPDDEDEDDDDYDSWYGLNEMLTAEEADEALKHMNYEAQRFSDAVRKFSEKAATSDDVANVCASTEVYAFGECSPSARDLLEYFYGPVDSMRIIDIIKDNDRETAEEKLRDMEYFDRFTPESMDRLFKFVLADDYYDYCKITQEFNGDEVTLEIQE